MDDYTLLPRSKGTPAEAAFCLRMDHDLMEPWLKKGELLYVSRSETPEEFQPGLFWYRGQILCRQWCEDSEGNLHLLCANPRRERDNLILSLSEKAACLCLGRVLTKQRLPMPLYR